MLTLRPGPLVLVLAGSLATSCWDYRPGVCSYSLRCRGNSLQSCVGGDEPGQGIRESIVDCGPTAACIESGAVAECALLPIRDCTETGCEGDVIVYCGLGKHVTDTEDCAADKRICRRSTQSVSFPVPQCVLSEPPCAADTPDAICAEDGAGVYYGCSDDFGYPTDYEACDPGKSCQVPNGGATCAGN